MLNMDLAGASVFEEIGDISPVIFAKADLSALSRTNTVVSGFNKSEIQTAIIDQDGKQNN